MEPEDPFWGKYLVMRRVIVSSITVAEKRLLKIHHIHDSYMGSGHRMHWTKNFPAGAGAIFRLGDMEETTYLQAAEITKIPVTFQ